MRIVTVLLSTLLLVSCATVFNGPNDRTRIATTNNQDYDNTDCQLINEEGVWYASPNVSVKYHRDGNAMTISCENTIQKGHIIVDPDFDGGYMVINFLVDFCIVSCTIDAITNSFYDYPDFISVRMKNK
jgi:hypothetical protein